jgi:hypothetical protein
VTTAATPFATAGSATGSREEGETKRRQIQEKKPKQI